jgi:hypothetical protein
LETSCKLFCFASLFSRDVFTNSDEFVVQLSKLKRSRLKEILTSSSISFQGVFIVIVCFFK